MNLMDKMKLASELANMSPGEKFLASLQVTIFGMAIVFVVLFVLFLVIKLLELLLHKTDSKSKDKEEKQKAVAVAQVGSAEDRTEETREDEELVAVITAAIAASLHTSTHNILVKNIVRIADETPNWGKLGRIQQINTRQ